MKTLDTRTQTRRLLRAAAVLFLLFFAWKAISMARYRYIDSGAGKLYRIDRWTDRVVFVDHGDACRVRMPR